MKAVYLERNGGANLLVEGEIPRPDPKPGEVLIKVEATAIMPTELDWVPTFHTPSGEPRPFPIVLSHEFSGVVDFVAGNAGGISIGDEVYGVNDWFANGAQAEYCVVAAAGLARKPKSLTYAESAVVPISALTAWQALFERGRLERGQRVLIHGGSGGVGTFAVQLARWRGARVIATTSAENLEFVRALGADQVIDYHKTRFEDVICDVDLLLDCVGGETLKRSWGVLKENGRLVTIASTNTASDERTREASLPGERSLEAAETVGAPDQRTRDAFMLVRSDASQLGQLAKMIDAGELRVFVEAVYPLAEAREAYARAQQGHRRGKIALKCN